MFNNEHMADIHFIVGPPGETQTVPAHKVQNLVWSDLVLLVWFCQPVPTHFLTVFQYVLAVGSSVFGAMFYGDLAEGQSEIHIPDVEPAAFLTLLK